MTIKKKSQVAVEQTKESTELVVAKQEVPAIVKQAVEIEITSQEGMKTASEILSRLNQWNDRVIADRETLTVPLNALLKNIRERYKGVETMLKGAIDPLRMKIGAYQTAETRRAAEEADRISRRVGEGRGHIKVETAVNKMSEIEKPDAKVETDAGMVKFREDKVLKIVDKAAAIAYLCKAGKWDLMSLDERGVKAALIGGAEIPGAVIEVVQTPINMR